MVRIINGYFSIKQFLINSFFFQMNIKSKRVMLFILPLFLSFVSTYGDHGLTKLAWTGGNFRFPCPSTKSLYRSSGKYIPKNVIGTRAQMLDNDLFVAFPRYKTGTPATLARATHRVGHCELKFEPFPCWQMQEEGNCNSLQSVVDVFLDQNQILWVLDTGILNTLGEPERRCPPKILAFNAKSGKQLKTITLTDLVNAQSRLQYLAVEYSKCGRCFIYVTDAANRALLIHDVQAGRGYRLLLPKSVTEGCSNRAVLYLALVRRSCGSSILYFTYLGSTHLFAIRTEYLQTGSIGGRITGNVYYSQSIEGN